MPRKSQEQPLTIAFFGKGEVTEKELTALLDDYLEVKEGKPARIVEFVIPVTKDHFTDTLAALVAYADEHEIPYQAVTDEEGGKARGLQKTLTGSVKKHTVARISQKVISTLTSAAGDAVLVVIWSDDDTEALEDICSRAADKEIPIRDLTNGMEPIEVTSVEDPEPGEDEPTDDEPQSEAAPDDDDDDEGDEGDDAVGGIEIYSAEELEGADLDTLKAIAKDDDIEVPPRTRATTLRTLILEFQEGLEKQKAKADEVLKSVKVEADVDYDRIAEGVTESVLEGLLAEGGPLDVVINSILEEVKRLIESAVSTLVDVIADVKVEPEPEAEPEEAESENEPEDEPAPSKTIRRTKRRI